MPTDLDYFYERDLDKTNIRDFYESLPSHLKTYFKRCNHANIAWGNVLQGYRGPPNMCNNGSGDSDSLHPSHGIQEVKFWWGYRKDLNMQIPVAGTFAFGIGRVIQSFQNQMEWSSLYFDSKTGECLSHDKNEAAEKLNNIGLRLHGQGKYSEAAKYHENAYQACSGGYCNEQTFKGNAKKAESEVEAISLNSQGDCLFAEGRYGEAMDKYREAYNTSQVSEQSSKHNANRDKAQAEIDAMDLCSQADSLFEQGKYNEAEVKYQEAYDKSQVEKQKNLYSGKKVQIVIDNLLDTLWAKAWDAENDSEKDRAEEAEEIFAKILREARNSLQLFPDNLKLKRYEILVTLKIEGNTVFNGGVELQNRGVTLFEEAQQLNRQAKYELANGKFKQAKSKFLEAREKFERGKKSDQRFSSCVEFVQERIDEVTESIRIIEQCMVGARLQNLNVNLSSNERLLDDASSEPSTSNQHSNYYQHI